MRCSFVRSRVVFFALFPVVFGRRALGQGQLEREALDRNGRTLHFRNVTASRVDQLAEVVGPHHKGIAVGDYDRDGDPDVAMAVAAGIFGSRVNKLYRNDGGVFVEVTGAPIAPELALAEVSRVAEFRDFDGDGWLDLLLVNDSFEFNDPIRLFLNRQSLGQFTHFEEVGTARGLGYDWSCGAIAFDVDGDGDCDVSSANYGGLGQDTLYLNDGAGFFTEVTGSHMPTEADFSVDQAIGDVNGDGKPDLLVSNEGAPTYIYYNDLRGQADHGVGDYRYGAVGNDGLHDLGNSPSHGSLEPADFDRDGRIDLYWANRDTGNVDVVLHNTGNDADGRARFEEVPLPPHVSGISTNKVAVVDLDDDGRLDVFAMTADRPAILRNVSTRDEIVFLDWTPADAFPSGGVLAGMSAGVLDADGDRDLDLFVGALTDDHVFERVAGTEVRAAELAGGLLPDFKNGAPVAVRGRLGPGESRVFDAGLLGPTGYLAAVLRDAKLRRADVSGAPLGNAVDYVLEVLHDGAPVALSDRGEGILEEVLDVPLATGNWSVRVQNTGKGPAGFVLELLARSDGPDNDLCENPITVGNGLTPFTNQGAQTDGPAHAACLDFGDDNIQSDVWFQVQASCTGLMTVSTCGLADYDSKIGVYSGTACPVDDTSLLGCNEDTPGCANYTSMVTVPVVAGEWYKIRVGGWLGAQGSGMLSVTCQP